MLPADRLILDLVELSLLHPAVLELAVSEALSGRGREGEKRRADLSAAIADTYRELLHLTSAIAAGAGGNLVSIVQAIGEREACKAVLTSELAFPWRTGRVSATRRCDREGAHRGRNRRLADDDTEARAAGAIAAQEATARAHHGAAGGTRRRPRIPIS